MNEAAGPDRMRKKRYLRRLRSHARRLKHEAYALYLAIRDRETPWYAKVLGTVVVGYALSPLDFIPDFIPILGLLDDLILVPAGIALVRRLIPPEVMARCRERAKVELAGKKLVSRAAMWFVIVVWSLILVWVMWIIAAHISSSTH
jgi:uncharacterized membrane protein YkvA (DUF1232 family)